MDENLTVQQLQAQENEAVTVTPEQDNTDMEELALEAIPEQESSSEQTENTSESSNEKAPKQEESVKQEETPNPTEEQNIGEVSDSYANDPDIAHLVKTPPPPPPVDKPLEEEPGIIMDILNGGAYGLLRGALNVGEAAIELGDKAEKNISLAANVVLKDILGKSPEIDIDLFPSEFKFDRSELIRPQTVFGDFAQMSGSYAIVNWMTRMIMAGSVMDQLLNSGNKGKIAAFGVTSLIANYFNTDTSAKNMANLLLEHFPDDMKNTFIEELALNPADKPTTARLKNMIAGFGTDMTAFATVKLAGATLKYLKNTNKAKDIYDKVKALRIFRNDLKNLPQQAPSAVAPVPLEDPLVGNPKMLNTQTGNSEVYFNKFLDIPEKRSVTAAKEHARDKLYALMTTESPEEAVVHLNEGVQGASQMISDALLGTAIKLQENTIPALRAAAASWRLNPTDQAAKELVKDLTATVLSEFDALNLTRGETGWLLMLNKHLESNSVMNTTNMQQSDPTKLDPMYHQLLDNTFTDDAAFQEFMAGWESLMGSNTSLADIDKYARNVMNPKEPLPWYRVLDEKVRFFYMNSILSGPWTHLANYVSNKISTHVLAGSDIFFEQALGHMDPLHAPERMAQYYKGLRKGAEMKDTYWDLMIRYNNPLIDGLKTETRKSTKFLVNRNDKSQFVENIPNTAYKKIVGYPTRALEAADQASMYQQTLGMLEVQLWDYMHSTPENIKRWNSTDPADIQWVNDTRLEMYKQAFGDVAYAPAQTVNGVQTGVLKKGAWTDQVNPTIGLDMPSLKKDVLAYHYHEKNEDAVAGWLSKLGNFINKGPFGFLLAPFINTPVNVIKQATWVHSPLRIYDWFKNATDDNMRAKILGQAVTGMWLWGTMAYLAYKGVVTGSASFNKEAREAQKEGGFKPNSLRIGPFNTPLRYLGAFGIAGSLMANMLQRIEKVDPEKQYSEENVPSETLDMIQNTFGAFFEMAGDQTFLKQFGTIMQMVNEPDEKRRDRLLKNYAKSLLGNMVPSVLNSTKQVFDSEGRSPDDGLSPDAWMEVIYNRFPFLSRTVTPNISWLTGEPVNVGFLNDIVPDTRRKGVAEILALNSRLPRIRPTSIYEFDLDQKRFNEFKHVMGTIKIPDENDVEKTLYEALDAKIHSPEFTDVGPENPSARTLSGYREQLLNDIINRYFNQAKGVYLEQHPELFALNNQVKEWNARKNTPDPMRTAKPSLDNLSDTPMLDALEQVNR